MKKKLHKLAIEYPIITILVVILMICSIWIIGKYNKVDKYLELHSEVTFNEEEKCYLANIDVAQKYYEDIKNNKKIIWYTDLESAVYYGKIKSITQHDGNCHIIITINPDDYKRENSVQLIFKIIIEKESVLSHLLSNR